MQSACALHVTLLRIVRLHRSYTLDFYRSKTDPFALLQNVVFGDGLAVDSDQIIFGLSVRNYAAEELLHGLAGLDLHVVRESSVVIDDEKFFVRCSLIKSCSDGLETCDFVRGCERPFLGRGGLRDNGVRRCISMYLLKGCVRKTRSNVDELQGGCRYPCIAIR